MEEYSVGATLTFLRRTQEEVNVFGGEVYIDVDGRNVGKLGLSDYDVRLSPGKHTIKMYKSHVYDTFIGVAEVEIDITESEHLMLKYSAPMVVSQPGNIVVSEYSRYKADAEARTRSETIEREYQAEQERKAESSRKGRNAAIIVVVFIVLCWILWMVNYSLIWDW